MAKINEFSRRTIREIIIDDDKVFITNDFGIAKDVGSYHSKIMTEGELYRIDENRIMMMLSGGANCETNLEEYNIKAGDVVIAPQGSILQLNNWNPETNLNGVMLPSGIEVDEIRRISTNDAQWSQLCAMFNLLWDVAHTEKFLAETVRGLSLAMVSFLNEIYTPDDATGAKSQNRSQEIFKRFKQLVSDYCREERTIPFYADKLCITPHHLSAVIAKASGKSAMYWINRATMLNAKILLKDNNLSVSQISEMLNFPDQSSFGKFFKREAGVSPGEYKKI